MRRRPGRLQPDTQQPKEPGWGLVDWAQYNEPWQVRACHRQAHVPACADVWRSQVPWGWQRTLLGMVAWASSFAAVGIIVLPLLAKLKKAKVRSLPDQPARQACQCWSHWPAAAAGPAPVVIS